MSNRHSRMIAAALGAFSLLAGGAASAEDWTVKPSWISAHENFLASPALRGRGSATHDEVVAATYVASIFESYGLAPAPGMDGFLQTVPLTRTSPSGHARLTVGDVTISEGEGLSILFGSGAAASGTVAVSEGEDPATVPAAEVVLIAPPEGPGMRAFVGAAMQKGAKLVVLRETEAVKAAATGLPTRARYDLVGAPARSGATVVVLAPDAFDRLRAAGSQAMLDPGEPTVEDASTVNAIGYLAGSDPDAGVIMISAHLDHLGIKDGVLYPGANDDASGTTAVMELAHALAAGEQPKRGILFVSYGSEEAGLLGSQYFADHPPVPLESIVANLEIEMIGQQDPALPPGVMMMTGFDRSDFGPGLKARGALVTADPYPEQNFFQRSDNYALALKGIVAHTVSGWATIPTYHTPDDTIASLDIPFMTAAVQSLVEPVRDLASGEFTPAWTAEGRPTP